MVKIKSGSNINPADKQRKLARKKELKKQKEIRKQTREASILYKDTTKLEKDIEKYTALKNDGKIDKNGLAKLKSLKEQFDNIRKARREKGIQSKKINNELEDVAYDPLNPNNEEDSSESESDSDISDSSTEHLSKEETGETDSNSKFPPMPVGTPPFSNEELEIPENWPPPPPGKPPHMFYQNRPPNIPPLQRPTFHDQTYQNMPYPPPFPVPPNVPINPAAMNSAPPHVPIRPPPHFAPGAFPPPYPPLLPPDLHPPQLPNLSHLPHGPSFIPRPPIYNAPPGYINNMNFPPPPNLETSSFNDIDIPVFSQTPHPPQNVLEQSTESTLQNLGSQNIQEPLSKGEVLSAEPQIRDFQKELVTLVPQKLLKKKLAQTQKLQSNASRASVPSTTGLKPMTINPAPEIPSDSSDVMLAENSDFCKTHTSLKSKQSSSEANIESQIIPSKETVRLDSKTSLQPNTSTTEGLDDKSDDNNNEKTATDTYDDFMKHISGYL
ncbi:hypothetical protein BB560_002742 [Smittium megazygosporum]|uniref:Wbp11/ELF5/Saf1 N-terminal domain-containing protein n=1 Tax=Smittium megazygosporum TaxID=133381 RepID=A0A2T9ZDZ1_9FUNG|nr:hypothetical protein BB560_002742 [Smittium megazygosporum]